MLHLKVAEVTVKRIHCSSLSRERTLPLRNNNVTRPAHKGTPFPTGKTNANFCKIVLVHSSMQTHGLCSCGNKVEQLVSNGRNLQ